MGEILPPNDENYLRALNKIMDGHFEVVKNRFDSQDARIEHINNDLRERIKDVKIDIVEVKNDVKELTKTQQAHLLAFTKVESEQKNNTTNRNSIVGIVLGMVASIVVTIITKVIGF